MPDMGESLKSFNIAAKPTFQRAVLGDRLNTTLPSRKEKSVKRKTDQSDITFSPYYEKGAKHNVAMHKRNKTCVETYLSVKKRDTLCK